MIYKTYFDVPDGAMCRPVIHSGCNIAHQPKYWYYDNQSHLWTPRELLGPWETEEKKVTITESEFDQKVELIVGKPMGAMNNSQYAIKLLKNLIFGLDS